MQIYKTQIHRKSTDLFSYHYQRNSFTFSNTWLYVESVLKILSCVAIYKHSGWTRKDKKLTVGFKSHLALTCPYQGGLLITKCKCFDILKSLLDNW